MSNRAKSKLIINKTLAGDIISSNKQQKMKHKSAVTASEPRASKSYILVNKKLENSVPNSPTSGLSNNSGFDENYTSLDQNFAKLQTNDVNRNVKFDSPVKCRQRNLRNQ